MRPPRPSRGSYISKEGVLNVPLGWDARDVREFLQAGEPLGGNLSQMLVRAQIRVCRGPEEGVVTCTAVRLTIRRVNACHAEYACHMLTPTLPTQLKLNTTIIQTHISATCENR